MAKIKVLRIINRFSIGGPSFHAIILTKHLGADFETKLIGGIPDAGEADSFYVLNTYQVDAITIPEMQRSLNVLSDIKSYFKIKQIIKEFQPDIVHTHASKAGALGRWAAYRSGVKTIVHTYHGHVFHSYFGKFKTAIYKFVERYLAKKSSGIIAISDSQKDELSRVFKICPAIKIQVIPLGLTLEPFTKNTPENKAHARLNLGLKPDEIAIGIVGRLAPIKDHLFFLDVIEKVLLQCKLKIKVFVVGDGVEKANVENRALDINNRFPNTIQLTSWVKDMPPIYHALDVVCLTSKNEGTPVTLIEAQSAGVPVVSTDVGGVRDVLEHGKAGFLVPKNDLNKYVESLIELIQNPELRRKMGMYGQASVPQKFTYQRLVRDVEEYYHELIKGKRL